VVGDPGRECPGYFFGIKTMNDIRDHLILIRDFLGGNAYNDFMLAHGRAYVIDPNTFKGERGEPQNCYGNSTMLAVDDPDLTYVEGKVTIHGVPIDHAWCVTTEGVVIDPTLIDKGQVGCYFGVPFLTSYVRRAVMTNKFYGLLDCFSAMKTAPKLFELGLEAGQDWLLNQKRKKKR
jgi:hypothetical protein